MYWFKIRSKSNIYFLKKNNKEEVIEHFKKRYYSVDRINNLEIKKIKNDNLWNLCKERRSNSYFPYIYDYVINVKYNLDSQLKQIFDKIQFFCYLKIKIKKTQTISKSIIENSIKNLEEIDFDYLIKYCKDKDNYIPKPTMLKHLFFYCITISKNALQYLYDFLIDIRKMNEIYFKKQLIDLIKKANLSLSKNQIKKIILGLDLNKLKIK